MQLLSGSDGCAQKPMAQLYHNQAIHLHSNVATMYRRQKHGHRTTKSGPLCVINLLLTWWKAYLSSAGGKRLLRQWLCRPLRSTPAINDRLDAVEEIASRPGLIAPFRRLLKTMPDLERALGRARNSNAPPAEGLPDWAVKAAQNR